MDAAGRRIVDWPADQRPRERLLRLGPDALTDAEVLSVLIGSGRPGRTAVDVARDLLGSVRGVGGLGTVTSDRLQDFSGIGPAAAARIAAATELRRRIDRAAPPLAVGATADVAAVVLPHLRDRDRERVVVAVLDRSLRVLDVVTVAEGTTAHAQVPTADIVRAVLTRHGTAFALAHNHPGGTLTPSDADMRTTEQVRTAATACGLRFLDHLIIAGSSWSAV